MEKTWIIEGKYEVISKIKQGGFGIVYYGFDRNFEKPIAIKAIEPTLLQEAKYIDMFLEEAKNAAKLNHNNIVHVYDLIKTDDGHFYIIMEYIDGVDLGRILKKCAAKGISIPADIGIYIIKEVCKALEYAHTKRDLITNEPLKLIHQDISPSNIMVSINGNVKLIDFGIAKIRFQHNGNPQNIVLTGKLPYMAPEQLNGTKIDRRADLFSLGTVFYEVLTNSRLFQAENDEKLIEAIRKTKIDLDQMEESRIPESIKTILQKMLQKDVEDRYQGANGIYIDLVEYLMNATRSVELSNDLGIFMKELFQDELNGKTANSSPPESVLQQPEPTIESATKEKVSAVLKSSATVTPSNKIVIGNKIDIAPGYSEEIRIDSQDFDEASSDEQPVAIEEKMIEVQAEITSEESVPDAEPPPEKEITSDELLTLEDIPADVKNKLLSEVESDEFFKDEIDENLNEDGSEGKLTVSESKVSPFATTTFATLEEEEAGEDEVKTVIDVIRLSAKTHKKALMFGSIGVLAAFFLFMILNVSFRWTGWGEKVYDYLFPPAIKIFSAPQGAKVYVDDKLMPGKTPLSIPKISPGVHKLTLAYAGLPVLTRSLQVPSKGSVQIAGEEARKGYEPYIFRFKVPIELNSNPEGATVLINNIKYKEKTPVFIEWEIGLPFNIEMSKPGFQDLTGFALNTLDEIVEIEDHRLWDFEIIEEEMKRYYVEGIFKKFVNVSSVPSDVTFYLDGSPTPTGKTGSAQAIALSVGKHDLLFNKAGFNSRRISVNVDENGPDNIFVTLTRNVRFFAKDISDPNDNELGATIVRIYRQGQSFSQNEKTPCEIALPPVNHKVLVKKQGYKDEVVLVSPTTKVVIARMKPENVDIDINVVDALTGLPIKSAQISYLGLNGETEGEVYFGSTDDYGKCTNRLNPGQYTFKVKKFGYFEKSANINTLSGNNKLTFKLIIQ